jgi:predicted metal-dependent phosphoesterase TrpH
MKLFDLHIHSKFSFDSNAEVEAIIEKLLRKGYAGFSITDHNTVEHISYIQKLNLSGMLFIPGYEYTAEGIDLLIYNVFVLPRENLKVVEVIDFVHENDGVVVLPHPAKHFESYTAEILNKVDGIEVKNKRYFQLTSKLETVFKINLSSFAKRYNKAEFFNSDSHNLENLATAATIINANTVEEFIWCVKNRLCFPLEKV